MYEGKMQLYNLFYEYLSPNYFPTHGNLYIGGGGGVVLGGGGYFLPSSSLRRVNTFSSFIWIEAMDQTISYACRRRLIALCFLSLNCLVADTTSPNCPNRIIIIMYF